MFLQLANYCNVIILLLICIPLHLCLINSQQISNDNKNILVILFPDGSGNSIQLKTLYDYSIAVHPNYHYTIVLHKNDYIQWQNAKYTQINQYTFYPYGSSTIQSLEDQNGSSFYQSIFASRIELLTEEFLKDNILLKLELQKIKYDILETDVPTYISVLAKEHFHIEQVMYLSNRPYPQIFHQGFEMNPSYYPLIGFDTGKLSTTTQRFRNYITFISEKFYYWNSQRKSLSIIKSKGYIIKNNGPYIYNSFCAIQYPEGITFPLSIPPNFKLFNSFIDKNFSSSIQLKEDNMLIYVSRKLINKYDFELKEFQKALTGFNIITEHNALFSKDSKQKIKVALVYSDITDISEALYNGIPIVSIGNGLMHNNIKAFVHENGLGIHIFNKNHINLIIESIKEITNNKTFYKTAEKVAKIIKSNKDAKENYVNWLDYGLKHKYDSLVVKIYEKGSWLSINGFDVLLFFLLLIFLLIMLIYKIVNLFFLPVQTVKRKTKK